MGSAKPRVYSKCPNNQDHLPHTNEGGPGSQMVLAICKGVPERPIEEVRSLLDTDMDIIAPTQEA